MLEDKPQRKGDRAKERIITKSLQLFARHGFANTSIQQIADKCDLSQTSVLYHYSNKEKLIEAVLGYIVLQNHAYVSASLEGVTEPRARLRAHFASNLKWACERREQAQIIILLYYLACFDKHFTALYSRLKEAAQKRVQTYLEEAAPKKSAKAATLARTLHDMLLGGIINFISAAETESEAAVLQRWQHAIDNALEEIG